MIKKVRVNEQIRVPKVRLISEDGKQIGVIPTEKALSMAYERDLDLVEVAPDAIPPVCRIMDYGKYKYKQEVLEKEKKKKQHQIVVKEIKLRPKIDENDFITKKKHIERFIKAGNKVKITIMFKGREIVHKEIGEDLLNKIIEEFDQKSTIEQKPKLEGYNLSMMLGPPTK